MPRRWVWSLVDLVAFICLGQAAMLAQREPQPLETPAALSQLMPLGPAGPDFERAGTRIYETPESVVVAFKVPDRRPGAARVAVSAGRIRLEGGARAAQDIPVPERADAARYSVRRVGDELRVVFARTAARVSL
jgi:hypothetical protein